MSNPVDAIWSLLFRPGESERYQDNPDEYMQETGLDQCDPEDLHDLVTMAYERGPVSQGASVSVGGNQGVGGSSQTGGGGHTAPPHGLILTGVDYPDHSGIPGLSVERDERERQVPGPGWLPVF